MGASLRVSCGPVELRLVTPRAAHQLFALARDPDVSRLLQWTAHESLEERLEYVHDARELWNRRAAWLPGIFDREREQLVGCIGLSRLDRVNRRAELGTWIGVPFQGRGYNVPAKSAMLHAAFDVFGLERVELLVRTDNERSIAAARRLPGIREEGVLARRIWRDDVGHDAVLFAVLADEFDRDAWPGATIEQAPESW